MPSSSLPLEDSSAGGSPGMEPSPGQWCPDPYPDPGPDLPSPTPIQGAPSLSLHLAPKSPGCTHTWSSHCPALLPFLWGLFPCPCMSWSGKLTAFHASPAVSAHCTSWHSSPARQGWKAVLEVSPCDGWAQHLPRERLCSFPPSRESRVPLGK